MVEAISPRDCGRRIALDGGVNVRDLGGYAARDGRTVRWRKLIRSGHLRDLSARDAAILTDMDVRTIHDFRRPSEIEKYPTELDGIVVIDDYDLSVGSMGLFLEMLETRTLSPTEAHDFVVGAYRDSAAETTTAYQAFFRNLLEREGAVVFHCMAGKDRTGIAAALILAVLDVPVHTIFEDYMLTADTLPIEQVLQRFVADRQMLLERMAWPRESLYPYLGVHPDNLRAFFEGIDAAFGSLEAYISDILALSASDVRALRERYLEME